MSEDKINAFTDGNSLVSYDNIENRFLVGNSIGILKVFQFEQPDLEPNSIDISTNLTSISCYNEDVLITNTAGELEKVSLFENESEGAIFRSELPLRAAQYINDGKRVLCGGDDNKLVVIDASNNQCVEKITLPDQLLNMSYNITAEVLAVSLSNGDVQIYSVLNESPNLVDTLSLVITSKVNSSMDEINYNDDHHDELVCCNTQWSSYGDMLLVSTANNAIDVYNRSDWSKVIKSFTRKETEVSIVDFKLSTNNKFLAVVYEDRKGIVFNFDSQQVLRDFQVTLLDDNYPINLVWFDNHLYLGSSNGSVINFKDVIATTKNLFIGEAEESDDEGSNTDALLQNSDSEPNGINRDGIDDSIIDEEDGDEEEDPQFPYYNKDVSRVFDEQQRKRQKLPNGQFKSPRPLEASTSPIIIDSEIVPYSPGSTPFNKSNSNIERRYLSMNSVGYVWAVKNNESTELAQQSLTVSFFDRSINKDYHFNDYNQYDLCGLNQRGILLASSGYNRTKPSGIIFYRSHESEQDCWDKAIPLAKDDYITSVTITDNEDSIIIVGTSFGYVRFYNQHGLCLNIMKFNPIVTLISSANSLLFVVTQLSLNLYGFSLLNINDDYRFIQHDSILPLKRSKNKNIPLIKGIFFNEFHDPCLVPGNDDTLIILSSWREPKNCKWIPILNCIDVITDNGNDLKRNWKCWPLGLFNDKLNCLVLKNNSQYPGFPLPLPVELDIKLPINVPEKTNKKPSNEEDEDKDENAEGNDSTPHLQPDHEENFVKSITMGKLVNDSLTDTDCQEFNDEIMEKLQAYSNMFDKSLLQLFASACQESQLLKALSIAKLMKNDKALIAASKISQRFEFLNLAAKIGKLRDQLVDIDQEY